MIQEFPKFITDEECDIIIGLSLPKFEPAKVVNGTSSSISDQRIADYTWLKSEESKLINEIKIKVCKIINTPIKNTEDLHIVRYKVGGEFKDHFDFFIPGTDYYESCMKLGGQRTHSILIYLNDDFEGGETYFPKESTTIKPEKGKLILWSNITEDGSLDYRKLHSGLPVVSGIKFLATIWVRENGFAKNLIQTDY